jgi:hypothetical protein
MTFPETASALLPRGAGPFFFARPHRSIDSDRTKREHNSKPQFGNLVMSSSSLPNAQGDNGLEAAVDQAIAACDGDMRSTIRALIVANEYLESEVGELMKAISHAYMRGRFQSYSG